MAKKKSKPATKRSRKSKVTPKHWLDKYPGLRKELSRLEIINHGMSAGRRAELDGLRGKMFHAQTEGPKKYAQALARYQKLSDKTRKEFVTLTAKPSVWESKEFHVLESKREKFLAPSVPRYQGQALFQTDSCCPEPALDWCSDLLLGLEQSNFNVNGSPLPTQIGLAGVGSTLGRPAVFLNQGGGQVDASLRLVWVGFAAATGTLRLEIASPTIMVRGTYRLVGDALLAGAVSTVTCSLVATLRVGNISMNSFLQPLFGDATPDGVRAGTFPLAGSQFDLPTEITFDANAGDLIEYSIILWVSSFSANNGSAQIDLESFGVVANVDADADVQICY